MYKMMVKLMIAAALLELGIMLTDLKDCPSRACLKRIEQVSRQVLKVDWKAVSVFPETASKFR